MRKHNFMNRHFLLCVATAYGHFIDDACKNFPNMKRDDVQALVTGDFILFYHIAMERNRKSKFHVASAMPNFDFNSVQSY